MNAYAGYRSIWKVISPRAFDFCRGAMQCPIPKVFESHFAARQTHYRPGAVHSTLSEWVPQALPAGTMATKTPTDLVQTRVTRVL